MKKKTVYNILMCVAIAVIAAGAVFFAGRHLGWFDKPAQEDGTVAIHATVRKGLANLTRGGIASELSGETALRVGDVVTVTSGCTAVDLAGSQVLLNQEAKLEIVSDRQGNPQVRLVSGEAFCQMADTAVTMQYGDHAAAIQNTVLVCTVRTGSETVYVLSGQVDDGAKAFAAGEMGSYVGAECSVQKLDLQALSNFALESLLDCGKSVFCSAQQVQAVLEGRKTVPADTPTQDKTDGKPSGSSQGGSSSLETPSVSPSTPSTPDTPATPDIPDTPKEDTLHCTIEIRCDTILNNMGELTPGLDIYVPSDGTILPTTTVSFSQGETVFDVLKRICSQRNIQIEYSYTPMYGSYYVEGINHLYEFDCGSQSGWMYKVNGWFPNYGCSSYKLQNGDTIVWGFTCKGLGTDLGAPSMG